METKEKEKVIVAYSGGLDTSAVIPWLKENYDFEVIACCCNVGQKEDFEFIKKKAILSGASKSYVLDIREEFVTDYIWPSLKAGAIYEDDYLLGTSMARPVQAKAIVDIAHQEGAYYICHGCTGKGNDQVRFEAAIKAIDPSIKIIAPWRQDNWKFRGREDLLEYSKLKGIPINQSAEKIYSRDENIWHISHEGGNLENPWNIHKDDILVLTVSPEQAPDEPTIVDIGFEKGVPVSLDGEKLGPVDLLIKLNKLASANGVGTIDIIENRLVGMKSRGVYETPGGTVLFKAHADLEKLILDRDTMHFKKQLALKYSELVYDGLWFTPLREAISAFVDKTQELVTGTVKMKLYKGQALPIASRSDNSLYSEEFVTFGKDDVYTQGDATGFISLFTLPLKIRAIQKMTREGSHPAADGLDKVVVKNSDFIE